MARPSNIQILARGTAPAQGGPAGTESDLALDSTANAGSPLKNSLAKVADFFFGRDRGAQNTERNTNGETADRDNAVNEPAHEEEGARSPSTSNIRKRPAPRDIYQIPASPRDGSDQEQEIRVSSPRKRARTTVKAKKAIVPPKRSLRNNSGVSPRQFRAEPARRIEPARRTRSNYTGVSTPTGSSPPKVIGDDTPQSAKRSRGRPRKNHSAPPTPVATKKASVQVVIPSKGPVPEAHAAPDDAERKEEEEEEEEAPEEQREHEDPNEQEEEQEAGGISEIIMDPSPVKPIPATVFRQVNGPAPKAAGRAAEVNVEDEESEEPENGHPQSKPAGEEEPEEDSEGLIEEGVLDKMIDIADRVGYHYNKESRSWSKKCSPKVCSSNGKRMMRRVKGILQAYETLRGSMSPENVEASQKAKEDVADLVEELQSESQSILTERLGNPRVDIQFFDEKPTRVMLQDTYFHIIPSLLKILRVATEVYPPKRSMEQVPLRHLHVFITMLDDLASAALIQPKDYQPSAESKSDTWNVSKPTSLLKPDIERIKKAVSKEFAGRELVQKAIENQRLQIKWARRAEDQERRKDAEIRRLRKENRRLRRETYEQLCSQPVLGRLLRRKNETRGSAHLPQDPYAADHTVSNSGPQNNDYDQDIQDEDDPFAEEGEGDDGPRLSVFGTNNTNDSTHSRPLSEKEKEMFVECMMFEHGNDRYVKAAEKLERSIDEIFSFAQDLQEAMDRKHENGQFNRPQDEWTYDIWVVQQ